MDERDRFKSRRAFFVAALLISTALGIPAAVAAGSPADDTPLLEVVVMDVGQGDGIYLRTPGGKNILIDVGQDSRRGVLPFLRSREINVIDVMVLTHPHADHIGGALDVMNFCEVKEVLDSGKEHPTQQTYRKILEAIQERGIPYRQPRAGDRLSWDPALQVTVLHPDRADYENINDNSIMIKVVYGKISFLFTGDAEEEAEGVALARFGKELKADVLKVGHHGSRTSSKPAFLDAVQPRYALISCGRGNSFGHPRQETLDHLEAVKAGVYRTDADGFLLFKTDGDKIRWSRSPTPFPKAEFTPGLNQDFASAEWSGAGTRRGAEWTLEAAAGENLWAHTATAPMRTRTMPAAKEWACDVSVAPAMERKTEAGLLLFVDDQNFVLFGIQEERFVSLTVVKNGAVLLGPELLVSPATRLGFRRTVKGLEALGYDKEKSAWRPYWILSKRQLPKLYEETRLGVYSKSWGQEPAIASFKEFKLNSEINAGVAERQTH